MPWQWSWKLPPDKLVTMWVDLLTGGTRVNNLKDLMFRVREWVRWEGGQPDQNSALLVTMTNVRLLLQNVQALEQIRNLKRFCFWHVWGASRQQLGGSRDRSSRSLICIGHRLCMSNNPKTKNIKNYGNNYWIILSIWGTFVLSWTRHGNKMRSKSVFAASFSEFNQQHIAIGIMYEYTENNMEFAIIRRENCLE